MDASYKIQRGIHVHLIQFFMCPEFWVHIIFARRGRRAAVLGRFVKLLFQTRGQVLPRFNRFVIADFRKAELY